MHFPESALVDTAGETGVTVVDFAFVFITGNTQFVGINYNDVVTGIYVRGVLGLVFATQATGDFGSHAAQNFILGINDIPFALHLVRFG